MSRARQFSMQGMAAFAVCLMLVISQNASASILGGILARPDTADEFVINELNDTNRERFLPWDEDFDRTEVALDDQFQLFLRFEVINTPDDPKYSDDLLSVVGPGDYQLAAIGLFTVTGISALGDYPDLDPTLAVYNFGGKVDVYETTDLSKHIDFGDSPDAVESTIQSMGGPIASFEMVESNNDYITGVLPRDLAVFSDQFQDPARLATDFALTLMPGSDLLLTREVEDDIKGLKYDLVGTTDVWAASDDEQAAGWITKSDTTVRVAATIPEPGSLTIMGLLAAIFGLVAVRRRK